MCYLQPDAFASRANFYNITRNFAFIGIMAIGMVTVIITGGIDLSVGSIMGLVGVVCGVLLEAQHAWYVALAAGLLTGMAAGMINGLLIAYVGLSPFVVTLGMLSFARSLRDRAVAEQDDLRIRSHRVRRSRSSEAARSSASPIRSGC